ncbi:MULTISPECIES: hypothetical protein [unclassified Saccharothrix]|uniref:hypothetical protein n=1 Tax=unclassified Saccharothrix TaxID=2593673 RepID=UPI00307DE19D
MPLCRDRSAAHTTSCERNVSACSTPPAPPPAPAGGPPADATLWHVIDDQSAEIRTRQTSIAWYRSTFYRDMRTTKVQVESTFEFTGAAPDYLAANQFELHRPYTQRRTVSLSRDGDTWRIGAIEKTALSKPDPKPGG